MDTTRSLPSGTVTFLFTDIEGSTRLWDEHPEAMRLALARHDAILCRAIETQGGYVFKTVGDAFCAAFATGPDALGAAVAAQHSLRAEAWGEVGALQVRMALHSGAAEERGGDYFGPPLNRVARLLAAAHGGQVLLSQATADLVREALPGETSLQDLGSHRLKDLQQPERLFYLLHPDLPADFPALRSLEAFAHNLPRQLTRFIGREKEIAEVRQLLSTTALMTLTGSGGCGKTRLALQVAANVLEEYADGVWLVELAPLADPALVPQAVATALGVRDQPGRPLTATLTDYLRPKSLLLVLDNCEHLLAACAQLADAFLRSCPSLQMLASSREGLGIGGERTYRVPSLTLPDPVHVPSVERLTEYEAVRLFVERAVFTQPRFAVTHQNAREVAQVCQRLDGIPLAIELAAARVKALSVEKLNARLDNMFCLLTGGSRTALPRHQTLRALIDWSYDLLSPSEQALLRRLSVFAGGWTLEAAEGMCSGVQEGGPTQSPEHLNTRTPEHPLVEDWEVLDLVTSLVEKSLVLYEEREGQGRYRLLETVRQYARDRLLESGEEAAVRTRHRDWFLALAEAAEPRLKGAEQGSWLERLEREHDNLRTALAWSQTPAPGIGSATRGAPSARTEGGESSDETSLRLAGALGWFWFLRSYLSEGRTWVEGALAQAEEARLRSGGGVRTAARAKALYYAGMLAWDNDDLKAARSLLEESAAIGRELGEKRAIAYPLGWLGMVLGAQGDRTGARSVAAESVELFKEVGDRWGLAQSLDCLGCIQTQDNDAAARSLLEESVALFRVLGDKWGLALSLGHLGTVAYRQGDIQAARLLKEEALTLRREVGHKFSIAGMLHGMGTRALIEGDYERAAALLEEALAIRREIGNKGSEALTLTFLAHVARAQGTYEAARARYEESLAIFRGVDKGGNTCMAQGQLLLELGDYAAARSRFEEGLARRRAGDNTGVIAWALVPVGHAAWLQGEHGVAQSNAMEALALFQRLGDRDGLLAGLESLAAVALAEGQKERAARLMGAAEALREALGPREPSPWRCWREHVEEAVRAACLPQAFAAAWDEGRAMALEEAIQSALED